VALQEVNPEQVDFQADFQVEQQVAALPVLVVSQAEHPVLAA